MSYCVLFCVLYRKESANKRYRNTVNNLISPNTVSQNDEKPHTAELDDTAIPHVKIKIIEIPHEKKPNTANPHVPLHAACTRCQQKQQKEHEFFKAFPWYFQKTTLTFFATKQVNQHL